MITEIAQKLVKRLSDWVEHQRPFDPAQLGDPVALRTQWTPAKAGGTNLRTHKLVKVNPDRLEFRATGQAVLVALLLMLLGLAIPIAGFAIRLPAPEYSYLGLAIGLVLLGGGARNLYRGTIPIVFDRARGYFWRGRKMPGQMTGGGSLDYRGPLGQIHALQIIREIITRDSGDEKAYSYSSYELNLVMENGERINIVDHSVLHKLRADATTLAEFLKKPVWDAA